MENGYFSLRMRPNFVITFGTIIILLGIMSAFAHTPKEATYLPANPQPKIPSAINFGGHEFSMGNENAPLTIVMYYSLTCGHCHEYQRTELPKIKSEFIDKGLVRFIFRDFPTDTSAVKAAKIAWCHGKQSYPQFSHRLLETQALWVHMDPAKIKEADANFETIALGLGIKKADYEKCLANHDVEDSILRTSFEAQKLYSIKAAPAFLINGKVFDDILTAEEIHKILLKMNIFG
jgi:protein-disulfide isomerase